MQAAAKTPGTRIEAAIRSRNVADFLLKPFDFDLQLALERARAAGAPPATDRRRHRRSVPGSEQPPVCARLRGGGDLTVCNFSPVGALVRAALRLLPGRVVEVQVGAEQLSVRAMVLRCRIANLTSASIQYEAALAFEHPVALGSKETATEAA